MLFIVRTKTGMIMSQDLTWMEIKKLSEEDKHNLLSLPSKVSKAHILCKWFGSDKHLTEALAPKTIQKKWGVDLSMAAENTFAVMLQSKRCPDYLKQTPPNKNKVLEFQKEWVKEAAAASSVVDKTSKPVTPVVKVEPAPSPEPQSVPQPAKQLNFIPTAIPVKERSDLINEMIQTFSAFGELAQKIPEMLKERQEELSLVEKKILDLRHIAELGDDLNAAEGYRYYKTERDALRRRRTLKDEIFALGTASNSLAGPFDPKKIFDFIKSMNGLDGRQYRPRAISEPEVADIIQNPKTLDMVLGK